MPLPLVLPSPLPYKRVVKGFFVIRVRPFSFPVNREMAIFSRETLFGYIAVNLESTVLHENCEITVVFFS